MQVYEAIVRHVDWEIVKCLVIAGPGFTKDSFKTFLEAEAVRQDNRSALVLQAADVQGAMLVEHNSEEHAAGLISHCLDGDWTYGACQLVLSALHACLP